MFLVIAATWVFFGPVTLEKADELCAPGPITAECYSEALEPIEADWSGLND
jgi:hypothetical protein